MSEKIKEGFTVKMSLFFIDNNKFRVYYSTSDEIGRWLSGNKCKKNL